MEHEKEWAWRQAMLTETNLRQMWEEKQTLSDHDSKLLCLLIEEVLEQRKQLARMGEQIWQSQEQPCHVCQNPIHSCSCFINPRR